MPRRRIEAHWSVQDEEKILPVKNDIAYIRINRSLLDKIKDQKIGPCYIFLSEREDGYVDMRFLDTGETAAEEEAPREQSGA